MTLNGMWSPALAMMNILARKGGPAEKVKLKALRGKPLERHRLQDLLFMCQALSHLTNEVLSKAEEVVHFLGVQ